MIENIIVVKGSEEFDFQAEGFEIDIIDIEIETNIITYINPLTDDEITAECEVHAGAAIIIIN